MTSNGTWTPETIRALGPTTDLPTLGTIFECSRWKSYQMARQGEWERVGIKVISIGSKYRVVVQSILDVLGYDRGDPGTREAPQGMEPVRTSDETAASSARAIDAAHHPDEAMSQDASRRGNDSGSQDRRAQGKP